MRLLYLLSLIFVHFVLPASAQERQPLWPEGKAPVGDGTFEVMNAFITIHKPESATGAAVVICPGGGYGGLVTGAEGHGIAKWLNGFGVTGIVLEYRLPAGRSSVPLLDAQRAIRTVRSQAKEWGINQAKIGIIGFSAGGHLASTAGTQFDTGEADAVDVVDRASCRPDFMILVYPVITMEISTHGGSRKNLLGPEAPAELVAKFSSEKNVTTLTPPTFLAHALDDKVVVIENSRAFRKALVANKVPVELVELESGGHGLNGYKGPMWDEWQTKSIAWMKGLKVIP
jgi:acetyl esterase/lipase